MKRIIVNSIKYGQLFVLVDDADYEWLNQWRWCVTKGHSTFYVERQVNGKKIRMHRLILNLSDPNILADHEDGNGLNNQRVNLRVATKSQNCSNRKSHINSTSVFIGVSWRQDCKRWKAQITHNYKVIHLGYFINEVEAAKAYNIYAQTYHGEFAKLNTWQ